MIEEAEKETTTVTATQALLIHPEVVTGAETDHAVGITGVEAHLVAD